MLVGSESKLGSTEDEGIGGNPVDDGYLKVSAAQPRPIDLVRTTMNGPHHHGDTHLAGSKGIYGLTREACWAVDRTLLRLAGPVKESHPPPGILPPESRSVHIAVLSLCLSFNPTLSLFQPHSEFFLMLGPSMSTVQNCNSTRHQITQHTVI